MSARRPHTALLAVLVMAGCLHGHARVDGLLHERGMLRYQDWDRTYEVYVPTVASANPLPVLMAFHGAGSSGLGQVRLGHLDELAATEGFILVAPDGVDHSWNDGRPGTNAADLHVDDVGFVKALIDELIQRYPVDRSRVYALGMSNGAMFAHRLGCEASDRIAAVGAVAGAMPQLLSSRCAPRRAMPLIAFNGTEDPLVPYKGGYVTKGAHGEVLSTPATRERWAGINGCASARTEKLADDRATGIHVALDVSEGCRDDAVVETYTLDGGGHTWPGGVQYLPAAVIGRTVRGVDASAVSWEFFRRFQLSAPPPAPPKRAPSGAE